MVAAADDGVVGLLGERLGMGHYTRVSQAIGMVKRNRDQWIICSSYSATMPAPTL